MKTINKNVKPPTLLICFTRENSTELTGVTLFMINVLQAGVLNHRQLFCRHSLLCIRAPDRPYNLPHFSSLEERRKGCSLWLSLGTWHTQNSLLLSATARFYTELCSLPLWCSADSEGLLGPVSTCNQPPLTPWTHRQLHRAVKFRWPETTVFKRMTDVF